MNQRKPDIPDHYCYPAGNCDLKQENAPEIGKVITHLSQQAKVTLLTTTGFEEPRLNGIEFCYFPMEIDPNLNTELIIGGKVFFFQYDQKANRIQIIQHCREDQISVSSREIVHQIPILGHPNPDATIYCQIINSQIQLITFGNIVIELPKN